MTRNTMLTAAIGLSGLIGLMPAQPAISATTGQHHVRVVGTGSATATPDLASFDAGVVTQATSAAEAMAKNSAEVERVLKTLRDELGIEDRDIRTSRLDVRPNYAEGRNVRRRNIVGYTVTNQVHVRVRDIEQLGTVLDALIQAGVNQLSGIRFDIDNKESLLTTARVNAIQDARAKAILFAEVAGASLGQVISIDESVAAAPQPRFGARMMAAESAVPVALGESRLSVSVTVVYALK